MDFVSELVDVGLLLAAISAVGTAIYHVHAMAKKTAWEHISKYHLSKEWGKHAKRARFFFRTKSRKDLSTIAEKWSNRKLHEEESSDVAEVFLWLNSNEFIATFILNNTIHMKTYARTWGWEYIEEWRMARDFIDMLRETPRGDPEMFIQFQTLATMKKFRYHSNRPSAT